MALPNFQTKIQELSLMQSQWASQLDPLLKNPLLKGITIPNVSLINGVTVINHRLSRVLQGWIITDSNAAATVFRSAPKNDLTLTLTSSAAVVCDIYVY